MTRRSSVSEGAGYRIFSWFNGLFLLLVLAVTAYPIYYVLIASFSNASAMATNYGLMLLPFRPYTTKAYELVFRYPLVMTGYGNTLLILFGGLVLNLALTSLGAYYLTLKDSLFRKPLALLVVFSMYFSGGLVPMYLNVKSLGLYDSLWSLIIPVAINTYNMLILRSAFAAVPASLTEAARLDGASHFRILTRVYLPVTGATMAVIVLYYAVSHWNAWFNAMLFIKTPGKFPLQLVLRQIMILNVNPTMTMADTGEEAYIAELMKYALIVVSTAPILLLYPFLQRFFVKGIMIGALKG